MASMASEHPQVNQSRPKLLTLSLELRLKIYRFVYNGLNLGLASLFIPDSDPQKWCWVNKPQLEFVSKQIRRECLPIRRQSTILHTSDTALLKTQPNQLLNELDAGARAAMSTLPRSITATITHLRLHLTKSLAAEEYDIGPLPKLDTITFATTLRWITHTSDGAIDDPKHLLSVALQHSRASSTQQWPPEGLPRDGVKYYLCVRSKILDRLMAVSSSSDDLLLK